MRSFNKMVLDEFFFYEASNCLRRAYLSVCVNAITLSNHEDKEQKKTFAYHPYNETLEYLILEKIYIYCFDKLIKGEAISLDNFKNFSLVILEKEIEKNKTRSIKIDLEKTNYYSLKNKVLKELPSHFENISQFDFENALMKPFLLKINLQDYFEFKHSLMREIVLKNITQVNWVGQGPIITIKIGAITKQSNNKINIVVTTIGECVEKFKHLSWLYPMIITYFEKFHVWDEKFLNDFDGNKPKVNKIIVYNPLQIKRSEVESFEVTYLYAEMEVLKILKVIIESCDFKTMNKEKCKFCENSIFCVNKFPKSRLVTSKRRRVFFKEESQKIKRKEKYDEI